MTFAFSSPLREAVYKALTSDAELKKLVGQAIFEAIPYGTLPETYVLFGGEVVANSSDITGDAAQHDFFINVHSAENSFKKSQAVAARICGLLPEHQMTLSAGTLVKMLFLRANMRRYENSQRRRIDLQFRAFLRA